jgi:hypothetical protein
VDEQDWLTGADPEEMLECLQHSGRASDRKMRLLAAACCRSLEDWFSDERGRQAVEVTERLADGGVTKAALKRTRQAVRRAWGTLGAGEVTPEWQAYWIVEVAAAENAYRQAPLELLRSAHLYLEEAVRMRVFLASLIEDIFGSPFRPLPTVEPSVLGWNDGCLVRLAAGMYRERDFSGERMAVLADALHDAGVANEDIFQHCREGGVHVRGCWLVDLLLSRE